MAFVFLSHEGVHWLTGKILGYDMVMTLNTSFPANGKYLSAADYQWISISGPVFTALLMIIFTIIIVKTKNTALFPFIFLCFYITLLAGIMNIFNPNDLGRVSRYIGLGIYSLPIAAGIALFFVMDIAVKRGNVSQKIILISVFWGVLFSSVWILLDQNFNIRIL